MPTIFSEPYINSLLKSTNMDTQHNTPTGTFANSTESQFSLPQNIFKVLSSHCSKWNWSLVARDIRIFSFLLNKNYMFFLICFASNKGSDFVFSRHPSQEPLDKIQQPVSLTNPGPPPPCPAQLVYWRFKYTSVGFCQLWRGRVQARPAPSDLTLVTTLGHLTLYSKDEFLQHRRK